MFKDATAMCWEGGDVEIVEEFVLLTVFERESIYLDSSWVVTAIRP